MSNNEIIALAFSATCMGQMTLGICVAVLFWQTHKLTVVLGSLLLGNIPLRVTIEREAEGKAVDADNA